MINPDDVAAVLDTADIGHGKISWVADNNHVAFSDNEQVFCKVTRPNLGYKSMSKELRFASAYAESGVSIDPLHNSLLEVPNLQGGVSLMSVWRYHDLVSFEPETITAAEGEALGLKLSQIHSLPLKSDVVNVMNPESFTNSIDYRINFASTYRSIDNETIRQLDELRKRFVVGFSLGDPKRFVINHGDCHVGNFVKRNETGEYSWVDFEAVGYAPPEFDLAKLSNHLLRVGKNDVAWEAALKVLDPESQLDYELFEKFRIVRLISTASFALLHSNEWSVFERRIKQLSPLLDGEALPKYLDRTDHSIPSVAPKSK